LASGWQNIAIGLNAGNALTTGSHNIAIGANAKFTSAATTNGISIGQFSESHTTGIALGRYAKAASNEFVVKVDGVADPSISQMKLNAQGLLKVNHVEKSERVAYKNSGGVLNVGEAEIFVVTVDGLSFTLPEPHTVEGKKIVIVMLNPSQNLTLNAPAGVKIGDSGNSTMTLSGGMNGGANITLIAVDPDGASPTTAGHWIALSYMGGGA